MYFEEIKSKVKQAIESDNKPLAYIIINNALARGQIKQVDANYLLKQVNEHVKTTR
jgi:hypothetical protein